MANPVQRVQALMRSVLGFASGLPQESILDTSVPMRRPNMGIVPLRGEAPTVYQPTGTTVRVQGFERHPVVSACIHEIVKMVSPVPWVAVRRSAGDADDEEALGANHPLQRLLDYPSPFLSAQRLRAFVGTHFLIYGNALWFFEGQSYDALGVRQGPPVGIRIIQPEDLSTVFANASGYAIWYMWRDALGYSHTSPVTDIMHFRDLSARSLIFGYPRAASAINDIIGDREASEYVREVVTNHGQPGGVFIVNEETTIDEAARAEAQFHESLVGRGNRGRTKFVGGVKDLKSIAFDLRELEFPDLRRVSREDICAAFGIDPRMIGVASASSDAGLSGMQYVEARRRLVQQTVEPLLLAQESELNLWLAPEYGDVFIRYSREALRALVEDDKETSERLRAEVGAGLATIEEARIALDRPAEYDTTHTLALGTGVAITPVAVAMAPDPVEPDDGAPPNTDEDDDDAESADKPGTRSVVQYIAERVLSRSIVLSREQRNLIWRAFDERGIREEAPFKRAALLLFGEERATLARIFARQIATIPDDGRAMKKAPKHNHDEAAIKSVQRQVRAMYRESGEVEVRWADRYHPLIGATYAKGAHDVARSVERTHARAARPAGKASPKPGETFKFDFHAEAPNVQQAIRARATRLAKSVGKTTARSISDAISIGMREGMSTRDIAKLVDKTVFGGNAGYRAEMIARTESVGALNAGEYETAVESGGVAGKEWLTQNDSDVRDTHLLCEAEGMIGVDDLFTTNGMLHPGDPSGDAAEVINCRCTLLYYDTLSAGESSVYEGGKAPRMGRSSRGVGDVVVVQPITNAAPGLAPRSFVVQRNEAGVVTGVVFSDAPGTPPEQQRASRAVTLRRDASGAIVGGDRVDLVTAIERDKHGNIINGATTTTPPPEN